MASDLIFVFAGLDDRKRYGLELFQQKVSPRILFSVSRFEVRRFAALPLPVPLDLLEQAKIVPPPLRHFFVLFEGQVAQVSYVRPRRFGTLTEVEALARWVREHPEIQSIMVVSSASHLNRIRMCCKLFMPGDLKVDVVAVPESRDPKLNSKAIKGYLLEKMKILLYWFVLKFCVTAQRTR